jgi:ATP-binding cassette subfamily B protein
LELATGVDSIKELRLFGTEEVLLSRQRAGWSQVTRAMWRGQLRGALLRAGGQAFFALGYGGAILLELSRAAQGTATVGDLVLVIILAVQVATQVSGALGLLPTVRSRRRWRVTANLRRLRGA